MNSAQTPKSILRKTPRAPTLLRADSSTAQRSSPIPSTSTGTGGDTITPTSSSKKKRKKNGTKEERLRRREEKKFNEMYAPKDTRVSLISPSVLAQFRGLSINESSKSTPAWNSPALTLDSNSETQWPSVSSAGAHALPSDRIRGQGAALTRDLKPKTPMDLEFPVLDTPTPKSTITDKPVRLVWGKVPENQTPMEKSKPVLTDEFMTPLSTDQSSISASTDTTPKLTKLISKGRSKKPMVLTIAELLAPENKKEPDDSLKGDEGGKGEVRTLKSSKALPKSSRKTDKNIQPRGNLLDSSGPIVTHRGKIRKPKVKKPTPLKRAILTSRALRRVTIGAHFGPGQDLNIENKSEILEMQPVNESAPQEIKVNSENEVKVEFVENADIKLSQEELLFRKLVEDTVNEAQRKIVVVPDSVSAQVKVQMHNRKFRNYCDMYVSKELHGLVIGLLKFLHRLQDKLYHTDPIKFNMKRRYVIGLKNVKSYLSLHKVKFIIIAPDIEKNNVEGGLDEKVEDMIELAKELNVPYIFSGHRFILGYPVFIKTPVSAVGVLDYQGGEDLIRKILEEAEKLRENYKTEFDRRAQELCKSDPENAAASP